MTEGLVVARTEGLVVHTAVVAGEQADTAGALVHPSGA